MILWRISNYADLQGRGGIIASGRWHTRGRPVVYLAESPAAALLEALVHLELLENNLPPGYQLLKVNAPESVQTARLHPRKIKPGWSAHLAETRRAGDEWLARQTTALLRVPSAVVPETWNWLLNPLHPAAKRLRIVWAHRYPWDPRLQ